MPYIASGIGALPIAMDKVIIFGGWNEGKASSDVYMLQHENKRLVVKYVQQLGVGDSFSYQCGAIAVPGKEKIRIVGQHRLFTFDLVTTSFESHAYPLKEL